MNCCACKGPYHPSTGHIMSEEMVLCGPCTKDLCKWLKGMMSRKSGGVKFYEHVFTSANKSDKEE